MKHLPTVLQLLGLILLAIFAFLVYPLAGLATVALELIYVGYELEKDDDASKPPT